jgi:thymidylate synthase
MIDSFYDPEGDPMSIVRDTPGELYHDLLGRLMIRGHLVPPIKTLSSPSAGKGTIELLNTVTVLTKVQSRLVWTESRPINVAFALGQAMYVLAGRDDVESGDYYNKITSKFSDNGVTLHGAYGPRIRAQLTDVIWMLKNDPGTRRAVITIFDGHRDHKESKDIPCPVSMQFLVRQNRVICITSFRSQNWVMLYPYDIFLFTFLHEWVACHAGYVSGDHIQVTASNHIYEDEKPLAHDVLRAPVVSIAMPPMDALTRDQHTMVWRLESEYRQFGLSQREYASDVPENLPPFWQGALKLLLYFAKIRRDGKRELRDATAFKMAFGHL